MASIFEQRAGQQPQIIDKTKSPNSVGSPFQQRAQGADEESWGKSALRTALQLPQAYAATTPAGIGAGIWSFLGAGELNDPEELERIRAISEREGVPFSEERYLGAGNNALSYLPTVSNIGREVESATGIPLEPKTRIQKGLRFATEAARLSPGRSSHLKSQQYPGTFRGAQTALPRPVLGAGVEAAKEVLTELGVPENIAELASFAVLKQAPSGAPELNIGKKQKPSGLTERRYESLTGPTEVAPKKIRQINDKVEKEVRALTDQIIETSPVKEAYQGIKNDVAFKDTARTALQEVQTIADTLPKQFQTKQLKTDLASRGLKKKNEGLTPSEFDHEHNRFIQKFINETPDKPFTAKELVKQYRKNNSQLSEAYEPGQSFAYNRAKREALLEYNRTIADMIEKEFPKSEFANLFKETNKRWADISNAENISSFLDQLFEGKINYKTVKQLFDKNGATVPFERAMGKEGFAKFKTLLNDLMSTEKGAKYLRAAEQNGFAELAQTAGAYFLHPSLAPWKAGYHLLRGGYNQIFQMLLDKPRLAVTWDRGINALKKGDYKAAQTEFAKVKAAESAFDIREKGRTEALKKAKEGMKARSVKPDEILKPAEQNLSKRPSQAVDITGNVVPKEKPPTKMLTHADEGVRVAQKENLPVEYNKPAQKQLEHKPKLEKVSEPTKISSETKSVLQTIDDEINKTSKTLRHYEEMADITTQSRYEKLITETNKKLRALEKRKLDIKRDIARSSEVPFKAKEPTQTRAEWEIETRKESPDVTDKALDLMSKKHKFKEEIKPKKLSKKEENHLFGEKKPAKVAKPKAKEEPDYSAIDRQHLKKTGLDPRDLNDLPLQIRKLKEYRDAIKGTSQESVKRRLPFNEKINEYELELQNRSQKSSKETENTTPRDLMKNIIQLRKEKKAVKGTNKEARNARSDIEDQIKAKEKQFYKHKREALPDLKRDTKPDISKKGLQTQQDYIVDAIEKALKNPPSTQMITIEVPGDGVFKLWNIEDVLKEFMQKVKKDWPVKQLPKPKVGQQRRS